MNNNCKMTLYKGMTLIEMVLALSIMVIVIAAVLPQIKAVNDSWGSKKANAEVLQNARVGIDKLSRSLLSANKIIAVSESSETDGYIEFEDNTGAAYRFDIAGNNNIEYGPVGNLSELAGPVSKLKFTCYDDNDPDTPLDISADGVEDIRYVKAEVVFVNPGPGQDKTFTTSAYLRTNSEAGEPPIGEPAISEVKSSNKFVMNMPSPRPDGDAYIAQIAQEGGANINSIPSGWTEIIDIDYTGNTRLAVYWKTGNNEPDTYTWNSDESKGWFGGIYKVRGDIIPPSAYQTGDSNRPQAPSVTTTVDNCLILRIFGAEGDERVSNYWPGGTTPLFQDCSSGAVVIGAAYEYQKSAGKTGTAKFKMEGSKKWIAVTVVMELDAIEIFP